VTTLKARVNGQWVTVSSGGGGGGTTVSEVEVAATDPIGLNPAAELWYDTDAPAQAIVSDEARWNTAWGTVAIGSWVASSPTLTNGLVLGTALNFTPLSGRRYRWVVHIRALIAASSPGACDIGVQRSNAQWMSSWTYVAAMGSQYDNRTYVYPFNGDGVASSWRVTAGNLNGGAITAFLDASSSWQLEDLGPVSGFTPVPNPTPGWLNVTFMNGWTNYASGFQTAQYRKIGDIVYLRGLVAGGTVGQPICNLPVGYRPPAHLIFATDTQTNAHGRCDVYSNGNIIHAAGSNTYFSLSTVQFSVTL
jgi:hypothetical protein